MADPRNQVRLDGIGAEQVTLYADGVTIVYDATQPGGVAAASLGKAVTISGVKTGALAADGDAIAGKLIGVEPDGKLVLQYTGFMDFIGGNGATLTHGTAIVGALGPSNAKGYVRSAASGTAAELIKCRGMIYDNTAAQVWVLL